MTQSVKCCSLDEQYKSVCFKDLEDYQKKYDYMEGYSELEQELIRKNLGIKDLRCIDPYLSPTSKNPVENNVVFAALQGKIDIEKVSKVSFTGNYEDLCNKPMFLPNPKALIIKGKNDNGIDDQWVYDGSYPSVVNLPTKMSQLENDKGFVKFGEVDNFVPIKSISVNHEVIIPDYTKNVNIDIPSVANLGYMVNNYLQTQGKNWQTVGITPMYNVGTPIAKVDIDGQETVLYAPTNNQGQNPYVALTCGTYPEEFNGQSEYGETVFTAGNGQINSKSNMFMVTKSGVYVKDTKEGDYVNLQEIIDLFKQLKNNQEDPNSSQG